MKPYYDHAGIQIFLGDCREILPSISTVDLICTDPPYNVGKDYGTHNDLMSDVEYEKWSAECVESARKIALNHFWVAPRYKLCLWLKLLPESHLIILKRGAGGPYRGGWSDQFEVALAIGKPNVFYSDFWEGIRLKGEGYFFKEETFGHPGYTPYSIMARAVSLLSESSVCDCFCGTGTTLLAAKNMSRKAIGIEIEEKYAEIAARRLEQEVFDFTPKPTVSLTKEF